MTHPDPGFPARFHQQLEKVWGNLPGLGTLAAVNHTAIGLRFMVTGMVFFLVGGLLAMLIRTQLALPQQEILDARLYNQVFTMHGTVMMFLFAIPVLEGLAMYVIPKMMGARDLAFPRLSAFGYYCYLFGGIIIVSSLLLDMAPAAGWFMYTPLSDATFSPDKGPDFWLIGITFVEISAISAGVELVVSILRTRAPGMTLEKMPIFCWYILAMALMIIFGFPPLILASILLELERAAGWVFFAVDGGGDPLLWQHLFWLFGHPEVYILFLPAAGIVSTLIPVFAGRPLVGYRWVVFAIIVMGFISFGLWVHHMFTVGIPQLAQAFFSLASMLVAIPTAIQIFVWIATLWSGKVSFSLPMLWITGFLIIFVCGGLTGVMLALVPFNWQIHDTHFVVAHMHYVLVGGMLFPLIAGLYYWLPHFSGRMPSHLLGRWAFWLIFIGFNVTFLLMHLTGLLGMPRRVYTYEAGLGWDWLNLVSSIGGFMMSIGVAMLVVDIVLHFRFGRVATHNPWQADSLEWATATPPGSYNFASIPPITNRHPLWENPHLVTSISAGKHLLATTGQGRRETLGTDAINGKILDITHVASNSWLPLQTALVIALVCIALLNQWYLFAATASLVAVCFLFRWSWQNGAHPSSAPLLADEPVYPPLHSRTLDGPGRWGMVVTLLANGTLFLSLLFGWFYLWTVAPHWQMPEHTVLPVGALLFGGVLLGIGTGIFHHAVLRLKQKDDRLLQLKLLIAAGLGFLHLACLASVFFITELQPGNSAHDALLCVMLLYLLLHSGMVSLATLLQALRVRLGYVNQQLPYEPMVVQPLWLYCLSIYWISLLVFLFLPHMGGML